jgi:hypothetical protein
LAAVQIVYCSRRGSRDSGQPGSAHDGAELEESGALVLVENPDIEVVSHTKVVP